MVFVVAVFVDAEGGMRPSRLGEVFDRGRYYARSLDEHDITPPQATFEKLLVCGRRCAVRMAISRQERRQSIAKGLQHVVDSRSDLALARHGWLSRFSSASRHALRVRSPASNLNGSLLAGGQSGHIQESLSAQEGG